VDEPVNDPPAEYIAVESAVRRSSFVFLWGWLHYPVALVLLWVALSFIYRYSPAVAMPVR
jgi:hypothetical protein